MDFLALLEQLVTRLGLAPLAARYGVIPVAAVAAMVVLLVLVLFMAFVSSRVSRARTRRRGDPDFGGMGRGRGVQDYLEEGRSRRPGPARPRGGPPPREGPGFMLRFRWLVAGLVVGTAGAVLWTSEAPFAEALRARIGAILESPQAIAPNQAPATDTPAIDTEASAEAAERRKIAALIDAFVIDMQPKLPVMVAPAVALARVEPRDGAVALGFDVTQKLSFEEEQQFRNELAERFRDGVCAAEPGPLTVSGLSQSGVAFEVSYTDPDGRIFAEWLAEPGFCSDSG